MESAFRNARAFVNSERELAAVIVLFFVVECAIGALELGLFDFTCHMAAARNIAEGKMLYRDHHGFYYEGVQWVDYPYTPLYLYLVGGIFYLFGANPYYAKVVLALASACNALLVFLIARRTFTRKTAVFASAMYMLDPTTSAATYAGNFECFALTFVLLALYFARSRPGLAGIAVGLGTMAKLFPIILALVLLPIYLSSKDAHGRKSALLFISSTGATIFAVSLPFLIACPNEFIEYTILYHYQRETTSISIAYYFLSGLDALPSILQAISLVPLVFLLFRAKCKHAFQGTLCAFSSFLAFSRVAYPKYWTIVSAPLWLTSASTTKKMQTLLIVSYGTMLAGCGIWDIPYFKGNYDFKSDPLFFIGAGVYALGAIMLVCASYVTLKKIEQRL